MKKDDNFIMKPKVDYCFKELMSIPDVRKGFIGALLKVDPESIVNTVLLPTIQEKKRSDDKYCILDVLVKMHDGTEIDFEMQLDYYPEWDKRSIYYIGRMLTNQLDSGEEYISLKKCIHVAILDFELFPDYNEFYTKFHLWDDKFRFKYSDILEFHIIELRKINKYIQEEGELLNWAKFFNSESDEELKEASKGNKYIREAYKNMVKLSEDEIKRYEYLAREKALRDHISFTNAARREGLKEGRKEGHREGLIEGRRSLIEEALKSGSKPEEISKVINIPLEEVLKIQEHFLIPNQMKN